MKRTKADAEKTREAVLAAAIEVFLERGVARATFDEIARAAGVTRGAIYWHFRDKLEIFLALERRANLPNEALGDLLKARLTADPRLDPLDELAEAIREGMQVVETDRERRRILTILWLRSEYVGEMLPALERQERADAALRDLFADGHRIGRDAPRPRARMVARDGGARAAAADQRLGRGLAARTRGGSARRPKHAADRGVPRSDQSAGSLRRLRSRGDAGGSARTAGRLIGLWTPFASNRFWRRGPLKGINTEAP